MYPSLCCQPPVDGGVWALNHPNYPQLPMFSESLLLLEMQPASQQPASQPARSQPASKRGKRSNPASPDQPESANSGSKTLKMSSKTSPTPLKTNKNIRFFYVFTMPAKLKKTAISAPAGTQKRGLEAPRCSKILPRGPQSGSKRLQFQLGKPKSQLKMRQSQPKRPQSESSRPQEAPRGSKRPKK